jgi:hypothetical protein
MTLILCVGGYTGTSFDSSIHSNYVFSTLEITFVDPDDEYRAKTMWAPSLVNFFGASQFKKPVNIITEDCASNRSEQKEYRR